MSQKSKLLPWVELYQSALLELDQVQLAKYLEAADIAIAERLQSLSTEPGASEERRAIRDALQNMRVLRQEVASHAAKDRTAAHSHAEMSGDYVACVNAKRRYVAVTDGVCKLLGYSREELLRKSIDEITAPEIRESVPETFNQYVTQGGMEGTFALLSKDGRRVSIAYRARVFPDGCMVAQWEPLHSSSESAA